MLWPSLTLSRLSLIVLTKTFANYTQRLLGRKFYGAALELDIDGAYTLLEPKIGRSDTKGQLDLNSAGFDSESWTANDRSAYVDNWGNTSGNDGNRLNGSNEVVRTEYDGLFQVLESLMVGPYNASAWDRANR
jgi:hypothetical protein